MTDITLNTVSSGYNLGKINDNFDTVQDVINDDVLHLEGGNNVLRQDVDTNGKRLINLPAPLSNTEPLRKGDVVTETTGASIQYVDDAVAGSLRNHTLAEGQSLSTALSGQIVQITDRANSQFKYVLASGVTPNTFNIIQCTGSISTLALVLIKEDFSYLAFGGTDSGENYPVLSALASQCLINGVDMVIDGDANVDTCAITIDILVNYKQTNGSIITITNSGIAVPLFRFTTAQTGTNETGVSGLTEGSTKLTGIVQNSGDWVVISSTEELIKDTSAGQYDKKEIAVFSDDNGGGLTAPLNTGNYSSPPTITKFSYESPLIVTDLNILGDGNILTDSNESVIKQYRRYVTFDNPSITQTPHNGSVVSILETPKTVLNSPIIEGSPLSNGYGILAFMTENITINDPSISNCRHDYSARHDKNTKIKGGTLAEQVDSHWGQNLILDGVNMIGQVQFAGRDISITNCQVTPIDYVLRIRNTSPELKGRVTITGNTTNVDVTKMLSSHFSYVTNGLSSGSFVFGRSLESPSLVTIANNHMNIIGATPDNLTYFRQLTGEGYEYKLTGRIDINSNTRTDLTKTMDIATGLFKSDNVDSSVPLKLVCQNDDNLRFTMTSNNTAADVGDGVELNLTGIDGLILFTNRNCISNGYIDNVTFNNCAETSGGAQADVINGYLTMSNITWPSSMPLNFSEIFQSESFYDEVLDDTVISFKPKKDISQVSVSNDSSLAFSGIAGVDSQTTGAFSEKYSGGASFAVATGVPVGTTNADGSVTVSPAIDQTIYVENRAGAAIDIYIKEL